LSKIHMSHLLYALHPGNVVSEGDLQLHYVDALKLVSLYGVNATQCFVWADTMAATMDPDRYYHLYPNYLGDYSLPKNKGYV